MKRVVYLISHPQHLPYLVVSIKHLRKHWAGEVLVYTWSESEAFVRQIASDKRLDIRMVKQDPSYRGKNDQFFQKLQIMQQFINGPNLYLDADTMPNGDLGKLFDNAESYGFCATQFSNWYSNVGQAKNRVLRLTNYDHIPYNLIDESVRFRYPSVNGGVFCCLPWSPVLKKWEAWTNPCKKELFIADETVLHVICREFEPKDQLHILTGHYNCSPKQKWWPANSSLSDLKIIHFHGDSNCRPNKSQFGFDLWWPEYQEVLNDNLGNIQGWKDQIGNKYLKQCEEQVNAGLG